MACENGSVYSWGGMLFVLMHIPIMCLVAAPAAGFVLSQNVPSGNGGIIMTLLRNSACVGVIQVIFSAVIVPKASSFLASFYYGLVGVRRVPPNFVIRVYRKQVGSALVFEVTHLETWLLCY